MTNAVDSGDDNDPLAEHGQLKLPSQLIRPRFHLLNHLTDQIGRQRGTTQTKGRAAQGVSTRGRSEVRVGVVSGRVSILKILPDV